jgi:hypothetical protein
MILMVLTIGMRDENLSDRLQLENDLKLEYAVNVIRKSEELIRQKQELNLSEVDSVRKGNTFPLRNQSDTFNNFASKKFSNKPNQSNTYNSRDCTSCFWCGKSPLHPTHLSSKKLQM